MHSIHSTAKRRAADTEQQQIERSAQLCSAEKAASVPKYGAECVAECVVDMCATLSRLSRYVVAVYAAVVVVCCQCVLED